MRMRSLLRLIPAGLLGAGAAVLVSCGSSGKGLIPVQYAGPLQGDFQAVLQAAQEGDGSCTATEAQIRKTEHDLQALPSSVDGGLRVRLAEGVAKLSARAHVLCAQPLSPATTTSTVTTATTRTNPPSTSAAPPPTATAPSTTSTTGTSPTATSPQPAGQGGGTQAPGTGNDEGREAGEAEAGGHGAGAGQGIGAGAGAGGENGVGAASGGTGSGR
jgi:hypothetical protein